MNLFNNQLINHKRKDAQRDKSPMRVTLTLLQNAKEVRTIYESYVGQKSNQTTYFIEPNELHECLT